MLDYVVVPRKNPQTKKVKYYPALAPVKPIPVREIIENISTRCTVNRADVKAVIIALEEVILDHVLHGHSVRLGDLGSFRPTIKSAGSLTKEEVTAQNIAALRVRFNLGSTLRNETRLSSPRVQFRKHEKTKSASPAPNPGP